jgi:hypothetical protein
MHQTSFFYYFYIIGKPPLQSQCKFGAVLRSVSTVAGSQILDFAVGSRILDFVVQVKKIMTLVEG